MIRVSRKLELAELGVVLALSLVLCVHTPDAFLTPDEGNWAARSRQFRSALSAGRWAETYTAPHPGVLTMWAGTGARALGPVRDWASDGVLLVFRGRHMIALPSWLTLTPLWLLARRLWGQRRELMGISPVALDPFLLAQSLFLHLGALISLCMTLSALGLAVYAERRGRHRALVLSGATAGLALLNKAPAAYMVPLAVLTLSYVAWRGQEPSPKGAGSLTHDMVLWGSALVAICWLVWPALWAQPVNTVRRVLEGARLYAATPHESGNSFWRPPRLDPGPALHPLALLFRLSPLVLLGLVRSLCICRAGRKRAAEGLRLGSCLGFAVLAAPWARNPEHTLLTVLPPLDLPARSGLALGGQWLVADEVELEMD